MKYLAVSFMWSVFTIATATTVFTPTQSEGLGFAWFALFITLAILTRYILNHKD